MQKDPVILFKRPPQKACQSLLILILFQVKEARPRFEGSGENLGNRGLFGAVAPLCFMAEQKQKKKLNPVGFIGPRGDKTISHQVHLLTLFLGRKRIPKKSKEEAQ